MGFKSSTKPFYSKILLYVKGMIMEELYGIQYHKPEVVLLQDTGIGVAESAARTCYDSFEN